MVFMQAAFPRQTEFSSLFQAAFRNDGILSVQNRQILPPIRKVRLITKTGGSRRGNRRQSQVIASNRKLALNAAAGANLVL
jgi:hypothetical protein